jgi:hypothetical protein
MAHIRAKRGTVSALTADADEFGTVRAPAGARWKHRASVPGAKMIGMKLESGAVLRASGAGGFRERSLAARPACLGTWGFLRAGGEPSTVTVRVQFSDRSFDRATKQAAL